MYPRALNFLATIALACVLGLVSLGIVHNDSEVSTPTEQTLSSVLLMSVTGIAALVAPAAVRRD